MLEVVNRTLISNLQIKKAYSDSTFNLKWTVAKLRNNNTLVLKVLFADP